MGWARDFVKGILDRYVAVFVGYSADDPPVRYLLEGLQQSNGPSNRAYAFQSGPNDRAVASWDEKGVQALLYSTEQRCGHYRLWDTLDAWGKRSQHPEKWRKRVFLRAQKGPSKLSPHERGMVAHVVSSGAGAHAFAQHTPVLPAEWLCVFDPVVRYGEPRALGGPYTEGPVIDPFDRYGLDTDPPPRVKNEEYGVKDRRPKEAWSAFEATPTDFRELGANQLAGIRGYFARNNPYLPRRLSSLASWIGAVAHQPACAWWAGQQSFLHHEIRDRIRFSRKSGPQTRTDRVVAAAWRALFEYYDNPASERDGAHEVRLKAGHIGWHEALARDYAAQFAPKLELNARWRSPIPPGGQALKREALVNLDVEYSRAILTVEVPDEYLLPLISKLRYCIEFAEDLESRYRSYLEINSIEPDPPDDRDDDGFSRNYKLSGHVLKFAEILRRLAALDPQAANAELRTWSRSSPVFERLRVWALGNLDFASAQDFGDELLALSIDSFWPFRGERDLLLGLSRRWSHFDRKTRVALERRLRKGPAVRRGDANDMERSAHKRLSRLNWMHAQGCAFTFDLDTVNAELRQLAPRWKPEYAANAADSHDGGGGWVRTDVEFGDLAELPPKDIVPRVLEIERRPAGLLVSREPFLGLSKQQPRIALAALLAQGESFPSSLWQTFLRNDVRENDAPDFVVEIATALAGLKNEDFASVARSTSDLTCSGNFGPRIG